MTQIELPPTDEIAALVSVRCIIGPSVILLAALRRFKTYTALNSWRCEPCALQSAFAKRTEIGQDVSEHGDAAI
jgi:hypothetical protein